MEVMLAWQVATLSGIVAWIFLASILNFTQMIRSSIQPWVNHHVQIGIPFILQIQSGHGKLARQMTLLMAFCDYIGNCIKDVISAPRPSCPPVRRLTATKDEEENAQEYGLPSSHTLNTVCLSGIYLGMHSLIDIIGGLVVGLAILAFWLNVHESIDTFITNGTNVTTFWAALSFLLFFAYPTPEFPTPSFEFHTAFNGVAFGIVAGVQQTYNQFHHENVPRFFTPKLTTPAFIARALVGIPTILLVKYCSKALAKWTLPMALNTIGVPIRSTTYLPALNFLSSGKRSDKTKQQSGHLQKILFLSRQDSFRLGYQIYSVCWSCMGCS